MDDRTWQDVDDPIELELAKERAAALGLAGEHLRAALVRYRERVEGKVVHKHETTETLLAEVKRRATNLMLQRESVGFVRDNARWILSEFDFPPEIVGQLEFDTGPQMVPRPWRRR